VAPFGLAEVVAYDPALDSTVARQLSTRLVGLDELLEVSDFVSVHCPLTPTTKGLLGARELALMKPTAFLINTARGGIVDEQALYAALVSGGLAGAAIDVFETEPVVVAPRLAELHNVLLAPHCIAWTGELFVEIGRTVCTALHDLAKGARPAGVVNPEVFDRPGFQQKWRPWQA
jgi:phosphoglycerate dehydrogenase-like enzyme